MSIQNSQLGSNIGGVKFVKTSILCTYLEPPPPPPKKNKIFLYIENVYL